MSGHRYMRVVATLAAGKIIPLAWKVTGTSVDGNIRWYLLLGGDNPEWEWTLSERHRLAPNWRVDF